MADSKKISGRKVIVLAVISLSGGVIGMLLGRIFGTALQTVPAWVGPAIVIGSIAFLVTGLLLLPTAVRAIRGKIRGPAV